MALSLSAPRESQRSPHPRGGGSRLSSQTKLLLLWVATCVLASWPLVQLQQDLDAQRSQVTAEDSIRYLPSGRFLSLAVLGFDNLAADLLWVRGIALFGERFKATQDDAWFVWLFQLIDLATDLDPRDVRIYKYGGIMLRLAPQHIDQSTYIFAKGMKHCPQEFFLPFGVAMNYLEHQLDPARAGGYMRKAATAPNAPFYLRNLAASILDQSRQGEAALGFLEEQLAELEPGSLQHRTVQVKIDEVRHDNGARALQESLNEFLSRFNRVPQPLEELQGSTWDAEWPVDPYGGRYRLEPRSGRIQSTRWEEVRARIRAELGLGAEKEDHVAPRPR